MIKLESSCTPTLSSGSRASPCPFGGRGSKQEKKEEELEPLKRLKRLMGGKSMKPVTFDAWTKLEPGDNGPLASYFLFLSGNDDEILEELLDNYNEIKAYAEKGHIFYRDQIDEDGKFDHCDVKIWGGDPDTEWWEVPQTYLLDLSIDLQGGAESPYPRVLEEDELSLLMLRGGKILF